MRSCIVLKDTNAEMFIANGHGSFTLILCLSSSTNRPTASQVSFFLPKLMFSFQSFPSQQTSSSWTSLWFLSSLIMWLNDCNLSKVNFQPNWGLVVVLLINFVVICAANQWGALKLVMVCVLYAVALHSCDHCGSMALCINCGFFGLSLLWPWLRYNVMQEAQVG